jgi:hypothetical protein
MPEVVTPPTYGHDEHHILSSTNFPPLHHVALEKYHQQALIDLVPPLTLFPSITSFLSLIIYENDHRALQD